MFPSTCIHPPWRNIAVTGVSSSRTERAPPPRSLAGTTAYRSRNGGRLSPRENLVEKKTEVGRDQQVGDDRDAGGRIVSRMGIIGCYNYTLCHHAGSSSPATVVSVLLHLIVLWPGVPVPLHGPPPGRGHGDRSLGHSPRHGLPPGGAWHPRGAAAPPRAPPKGVKAPPALQGASRTSVKPDLPPEESFPPMRGKRARPGRRRTHRGRRERKPTGSRRSRSRSRSLPPGRRRAVPGKAAPRGARRRRRCGTSRRPSAGW